MSVQSNTAGEMYEKRRNLAFYLGESGDGCIDILVVCILHVVFCLVKQLAGMLETQLRTLGQVVQHGHIALGAGQGPWSLDGTVRHRSSSATRGLQIVTVAEGTGVLELREGLEAVGEFNVPRAVPALCLVDQRLAPLGQPFRKKAK